MIKLPNSYGSVTKLSGKRRKPFMVRKTAGWSINPDTNKEVQKYIVIGYAATRAEGLAMLADYNKNPYDTRAAKITFEELYNDWSKEKYPTISTSNVHSYTASFNTCEALHNRVFKDIKLNDLQTVIDNSGKNYPTLRKIKILMNQLYDYAIKNDICGKDYSEFVNIIKFKDRNPNKHERCRLSDEDIKMIWDMKDDRYYQIVLMLIYNGCRVSELLDLKKENVHLDEQYFDVIASKTSNGIRKVPIADKVLPFYKAWFGACPDCEYLIHTPEGKHFDYRNYYDSYFTPLMKQLGMDYTPHFCRHTCASLLAEAEITPTIQKLILGHSGAMNLTEKVYTHLDVKSLVNAINKI